MTREEFDKQEFSSRTRFEYEGVIYKLAAVDFTERGVAFKTYGDEELDWVRCKDIVITK